MDDDRVVQLLADVGSSIVWIGGAMAVIGILWLPSVAVPGAFVFLIGLGLIATAALLAIGQVFWSFWRGDD